MKNQKWILVLVVLLCMTHTASGQTIPGAADSSRVGAKIELPAPSTHPKETMSNSVGSVQKPPPGSEKIVFLLEGVVIEGNTALNESVLSDLYKPQIGRRVTLAFAWELAGKITDRYKQAGYFLSRAYVPAQEIDTGVIHLRVVEGYVKNITISEESHNREIVKQWMERIKSYRPLSSKQLENALLELNSLPNFQYRAVLNLPENNEAADGATSLSLIAIPKSSSGSAKFTNSGSRYLGPHTLQVGYDTSIIGGQQTAISALTSVPLDEFQSIALRHTIPLAPKFVADINGYYTNARPGYILEPQEVQSDTYSFGGGITYQWIRQRDEALSNRVGFDWQDTQADILGIPITRDRLRLLTLDTTYSTTDEWYGSNVVQATITQGINAFGAPDAGQNLTSRAEARPDFTKLVVSAVRRQGLSHGLEATLSLNGQVASGPLYSSEEFGYGGGAFGRAYDSSEIVGDHGVSSAVELAYRSFEPWEGAAVIPYLFYDMGWVWNEDAAQPEQQHRKSAGFGLRGISDSGINADVGLAFPLDGSAANPIYSQNGKAPRLMVDVSYGF